MDARKNRLKEVYDHLRKYYRVHTKKDLAIIIGQTQPAMYSAFGGNEDYLTDSLFKRICSCFPGVFNIEYLLNGAGDLLTVEESIRVADIEKGTSNNNMPEHVQELCDSATRIIAQNETLSKELASSLAEVREMKSALSNAIASTEGLKQQLSVLLHILRIPNNHYQGLDGLVSELSPGKKMPITDEMVRIIKQIFPVDESKI